MKTQYALVSVLVVLLANSAAAQGKKHDVQVDKGKKEMTVNLDKSGTWKAGAGDIPKLPDFAKSERDRRQEQQETSGQLFIRKTF